MWKCIWGVGKCVWGAGRGVGVGKCWEKCGTIQGSVGRRVVSRSGPQLS